MLDFIIIVCAAAALICSVSQLCISFYDKGYNAGIESTKRRKKTK